MESVDRESGKHGLADVVTLNEDVGQGTFHKIHVMEPRQFQEFQNYVRTRWTSQDNCREVKTKKSSY